MPFVEQFDLATCFGAVGHLRPRDQPAFAAAVYRALRPGGRFVLLTRALPPPWSPALWIAAGFDAAMWLRNRLLPRREFVMYYLAFLLERALPLLRGAGFEVAVERPQLPPPWHPFVLVVATRPQRG